MKNTLAVLALVTASAVAQSTSLNATASNSGSVNLAWTAGVKDPNNPLQSVPVSSNVYRASGSNCTGAVLIASKAPVAGPYNDASTVGHYGQAYCYYVTSTDAAGVESTSHSNTVSVIIPAATNCTLTSPCAVVSITNSSMGPTVQTDGNGNQTSGPGTAILWVCMGGTIGCSQSNLSTAVAALAAGTQPTGQWSYVSFPMNASTAVYNDQHPYGSLMNYSFSNQWSTSTLPVGQAAGPASVITIFPMPAQPVATVPAQGPPAVVTFSTGGGTVGPQLKVTRKTQTTGPRTGPPHK